MLPGARIGAGAVIAAGSVVAGRDPAGAVAGGIPARVLRPSAPADTIFAERRRLTPDGGRAVTFRASREAGSRGVVAARVRSRRRPTRACTAGHRCTASPGGFASATASGFPHGRSLHTLAAGPEAVLDIGSRRVDRARRGDRRVRTRARLAWHVHRSVRRDHGYELPRRRRRPVGPARLPAGRHRHRLPHREPRDDHARRVDWRRSGDSGRQRRVIGDPRRCMRRRRSRARARSRWRGGRAMGRGRRGRAGAGEARPRSRGRAGPRDPALKRSPCGPCRESVALSRPSRIISMLRSTGRWSPMPVWPMSRGR